jgi:hypothetical protein
MTNMAHTFNAQSICGRRFDKYETENIHVITINTISCLIGKDEVHSITGDEGRGGVEVQLYSSLNLGAR